MVDLQEKILSITIEVVDYDDFASKAAAYKAGHDEALRVAAELVAEDEACRPDAAVAAIQFALETDESTAFLQCWNEGDFDAIRREWPEAPEEVFIGADPLHPRS